MKRYIALSAVVVLAFMGAFIYNHNMTPKSSSLNNVSNNQKYGNKSSISDVKQPTTTILPVNNSTPASGSTKVQSVQSAPTDGKTLTTVQPSGSTSLQSASSDSPTSSQTGGQPQNSKACKADYTPTNIATCELL